MAYILNGEFCRIQRYACKNTLWFSIEMNKIVITLLVLIIQSFQITYGASLRNKHVERLKVIYDQNSLRVPGNSIKLGVIAYLYNGDSVFTRGFLKGNVAWKNFLIHIEGGKIFNGNLRIAGGIENTNEQQLFIKVTSKYHPEISDYEVINLNYPVKIILYNEGIIQKSPGHSFKIGIEAKMDDGKIIRTGSNRPWWNSFDPYELTVEGGQKISGRIFLHDSPEAFYKHQVKIKAWSKMNPNLVDSIFFLLDYRGESRITASGFDGFSGSSGFFGSNGSSGSDGEHGDPGRHGSDGANGPDLDVYIDMYFDTIISAGLLKVWVDNLGTGRSKFFLVNPDGGRLRVYSKGGDGGDGGSGGSGGTGGRGYDGVVEKWQEKINDSTYVEREWVGPATNGGNGGDGGDGGDGGYGGEGGDIVVAYTRSAEPYLYCIKICSMGGDGGDGGSGGSSGSGGSGGTGNPNGSSGSSGYDGHSGTDGRDGPDGHVYFHMFDGEHFDYEIETNNIDQKTK